MSVKDKSGNTKTDSSLTTESAPSEPVAESAKSSDAVHKTKSRYRFLLPIAPRDQASTVALVIAGKSMQLPLSEGIYEMPEQIHCPQDIFAKELYRNGFELYSPMKSKSLGNPDEQVFFSKEAAPVVQGKEKKLGLNRFLHPDYAGDGTDFSGSMKVNVTSAGKPEVKTIEVKAGIVDTDDSDIMAILKIKGWSHQGEFDERKPKGSMEATVFFPADSNKKPVKEKDLKPVAG